MSTSIKHGDFSLLAENYSKYRPGYSEDILELVLTKVGKPISELDFVDVGAGTGIWTRMVAEAGCRTTAVEPNNEMRKYGESTDPHLKINWVKGAAESTTLPDSSCDLVSMASSFHWPDFDSAVHEFHRILRPQGYFVALWNPRLIEVNPMLVTIENKLKELVPHMKRKSSGRSEFCDNLTDRLLQSGCFQNVIYMEGRHVERMSPERYIGIWNSVNDIRSQAGEEKFQEFMDFVERTIAGLDAIEATYLTRAWLAQVKK